jgi:hypothetical protein
LQPDGSVDRLLPAKTLESILMQMIGKLYDSMTTFSPLRFTFTCGSCGVWRMSWVYIEYDTHTHYMYIYICVCVHVQSGNDICAPTWIQTVELCVLGRKDKQTCEWPWQGRHTGRYHASLLA